MARPRREGLDYFPMDTDFFESDGALLAAGEDPLALGVYLRLLCRIYRGETGYACAWGEREAALLAARMPEQPGAQRVEQAAAACARAGLFDEELLRRGLLTSRDIQRRYFSAVGKRLLKRLSRDGEIRLNGDGLLLDGAEIAELICGESRRPAGMALRREDGGICLRLIPQRRENQSHKKTETKQEINPKAETEEEQDSPPPAGEAAAPFAPAAFAPAGSAPVGFAPAGSAPAASVPEESSFPEGNGTGTVGEETAETGETGAERETPGRFGPGGRVRLLRADHRRLVETYGESAVSSCVRRMDEWLRRSGQHYRDPLSTLEKWLQSDAEERAQAERERAPAAPAYLGKRTGAHNFSQREYTDAELEALLYTDLDELGKG